MPGGKNTNLGRKSGEDVIAAAFTARGALVLPRADWRKASLDPAAVTVVRGYPYPTLYGTQGYLDFVAFRDGKAVVSLEIKHQGGSGSVDEKLPYIFWNALSQWPTAHGILVLSGVYWTKGRGLAAANLIRQRAQLIASTERSLDVFDLTKVTNWIAQRF